MPFPEKLPLTAVAVGLAAAFQAAESSTSFKTVCIWSLVIFATATETILFFLKPVPWRGSFKWAAGLLAISPVFLFVVLGVAMPAYRKEFLTEELRVNFSAPQPAQIGVGKLDLEYFILNRSLNPIVIGEISAVQISTTDFSTNPNRNNELCRIQALLLPSWGFMEGQPHPNRKVMHASMAKPLLPAAEKTYVHESDLPFQDDGKLDVAFYIPKTLLEGGKDVAGGAFSIDAGKAISLAASFDTDSVTWDTHNVLVICGAIKFLGKDGHTAWAACPVTTVAHMYQFGKPMGVLRGSANTAPYTITTQLNEGPCGVHRGL